VPSSSFSNLLTPTTPSLHSLPRTHRHATGRPPPGRTPNAAICRLLVAVGSTGPLAALAADEEEAEGEGEGGGGGRAWADARHAGGGAAAAGTEGGGSGGG
jgi:hypothetical protein